MKVIHGSLRRQPVSLKNQRTLLRARVSSMPIITVGAACPRAWTAVATRMRCTGHEATSLKSRRHPAQARRARQRARCEIPQAVLGPIFVRGRPFCLDTHRLNGRVKAQNG